MIARRRFLTMSAGGLMIGAAAVVVPTSTAQAATGTTRGLAVRLKSWRRLVGATVHATDAHGRRFALTVDSVVSNLPDTSGPGESFHVLLRARTRTLRDGIYQLEHRYLGGSSELFLVGGGATTATLSVDTRAQPARSSAQ